ncbi:glycosyltransferase family 2 protein [Acetobacter fallax]|uniref:Glycosyltransferase family 2 protein n=1 Tax=Acetobacter fallax TaxID=1737473 RepID=A0ABX0K6U8_9PROT|nr:glycosyltransferase family 2 protein [Acetobacter fallax]NHO32122.1 glycosyltransferase family 2 protein [Acetobacter fallax]NHO35607.1 glycosyltransferase family 2 protein [Acetobacter fallax]
MNSSLPSVAIALFVKNEFSDIAGWICWHVALGVKTIFIHDDHSSDGTWEIIQAAAQCYDIRATRTDPAGQPDFYLRQRDCFMATAEECRGKFDWLGFLDGDEYLYLRHSDSLPAFLSNFSHADGVAFSWRIYGSANRVVRPRVTAVEAFTRHSTAELGDNGLVKSFVRPEKMGSTYLNPHWFDVPTERYVRPDGSFVRHNSPVQDIDWSDGFIMHFICRSMEHYIQRIKRRLNADLSDSQGYWTHFDRNDETDSEPLRLIARVQERLAPVYFRMVCSAITHLRTSLRLPATAVSHDHAWATEAPRIVRVRSHFDTFMYCSRTTGHVLHTSEDEAAKYGYVPVFGAIFPSTPDLITFFIPGGQQLLLRMDCDERVASELIYRFMPSAGDGHQNALLNPLSNFYTSFLEPGDSQGTVAVDRHVANTWEHVTFETVTGHDYPAVHYALPFRPEMGSTMDDILAWIIFSPAEPTPDEFLRVMYSISPAVRNQIMHYVPGLLHPFL